ncbi:MAG: hypothetical protein AAFZ67_08495 [Planctomycetota bacterium]
MPGQGRPQFDDNPDKYRHTAQLWEIESHSNPPNHDAQSITKMIKWAIENHREGFQVGDPVSVGHAAKGLKVSSGTLRRALQPLLEQGFLLDRPKAPYKIVRSKAPFSDPSNLFSREISLTGEIRDSTSACAGLFPVAPGSAWRLNLDTHLDASGDPNTQVFRESLDKGGPCDLLLRLRAHRETSSIWMAESLYLILPPGVREEFVRLFRWQLEQQSSAISIGALLRACRGEDGEAFPALRNGRAQIRNGNASSSLIEAFKSTADDNQLWKKWASRSDELASLNTIYNYCLLAAIEEPTFAFAVTHINTDKASLLVDGVSLTLR